MLLRLNLTQQAVYLSIGDLNPVMKTVSVMCKAETLSGSQCFIWPASFDCGHLTVNGRCICLSVCPLIISTTIHPINYTLCGCIVQHPRKCSVECEVVWMSSSPESCKQQCRRSSYRPVRNRPVLNTNIPPQTDAVPDLTLWQSRSHHTKFLFLLCLWPSKEEDKKRLHNKQGTNTAMQRKCSMPMMTRAEGFYRL